MARMPQNDVVPFLVYHIKDYMISICLIFGDANFDHLIEVMDSRFCYYKVIVFHFVISKYSETMQIFCF